MTFGREAKLLFHNLHLLHQYIIYYNIILFGYFLEKLLTIHSFEHFAVAFQIHVGSMKQWPVTPNIVRLLQGYEAEGCGFPQQIVTDDYWVPCFQSDTKRTHKVWCHFNLPTPQK